nr:MAG TPA: hypothetical protein [Caudoviricetes sp.]
MFFCKSRGYNVFMFCSNSPNNSYLLLSMMEIVS